MNEGIGFQGGPDHSSLSAQMSRVVTAKTIDPVLFENWFDNAAPKDRIVYAFDGHVLPRHCELRDQVRALIDSRHLTGGQQRQEDGTLQWWATRTHSAIAVRRRIGSRSGDEERVFQVIEAKAAAGERMPDVRELARLANVLRHEVLVILQSLQDAGDIDLATYWGPMSKSWRVATIRDSGMATRQPPKGWTRDQQVGGARARAAA